MGSIFAILSVYGIATAYNSSTEQGLTFLLFAGIVSVGAIFSWAYLPDIQRWAADGKLVNRELEELGEGLRRAESEGQAFAARDKWWKLICLGCANR